MSKAKVVTKTKKVTAPRNPEVRVGSLWRYKGKTIFGRNVPGAIFEVDDISYGSCKISYLRPARKRYGNKGGYTESYWRVFTTDYSLDNFRRRTLWQHLQG